MSISYKELAERAPCSPSYATQVLSGERTPSPKMAAKIFRNTGLKLGLFAQLSDADAAVAARIHGEQQC